MIKLLKYELTRTRQALLITFLTMIGIELIFLVGYFLQVQSFLALGLWLFLMFGFSGFVLMLVYAVNRFYSDLKHKSGYLLFMTPRNAYQIVGSKLLCALLVSFAGMGLYVGLIFLNLRTVSMAEGSSWELFSIV